MVTPGSGAAAAFQTHARSSQAHLCSGGGDKRMTQQELRALLKRLR
jgi:hypothetical protein